VDKHAEFQAAMAAAIAEYRAAKHDVMASMQLGKTHGEIWIAQRARLKVATDEWGGIPRRFFG